MKPKIMIPYEEFYFTASRSSGTGGQNVNKTNTKVTLEWDYEKSPSISFELKVRFKEQFGAFINHEQKCVITSQRFRSQLENKKDCIQKLLQFLEKASYVPKVRKKTNPKRSAVETRLKSKKRDSDKKRLRSEKF
jgi:ribosome-associated protein